MKSILLLLLANLSLQCGAIIAKSLFTTLGALQVSIVRLVISAIMVIAFQRPWRLPFLRLNWRAIGIYGAGLAGMNVLFYQAISRIPMGIAVAIEFIGPLAVAVYASRGWKSYLWISLAAVGLSIFSIDSFHVFTDVAKQAPEKSTAVGLDPLGVLLAGLSGACWGVYIISGKHASQSKTSNSNHDSNSDGTELEGVAAIGMAIAACLALPFSIGPSKLIAAAHTFRSTGALAALSNEFSFIVSVVALALFSSAIPYSLEWTALKSLRAEVFGVLMSLQPVVAALMAYLLLDEKLNILQGLAIVLITVASIGMTVTRSQTEQRQSSAETSVI